MDAVTGAFSYTGKYIARRLLARGRQVITLTGHLNRPNEFNGRIEAYPYDFDHLDRLVEHLRGVDTLYNTYWVRFDYRDNTYERAVTNTHRLFEAACQAGVQRVVHVSITNPSLDSPLPYFRGKAQLEQALKTSGLSYAILRPTVLYSLEDILINNIAYLLRTFPAFAIPGGGEYRLQPVFIEDMADLTVQAGAAHENLVQDVVGPEIFTFNQLVALIAAKIGRRPWIVHLPPAITLPLARMIGWWMKDVTLTRQEYDGLSADLLVSHSAPTGPTRLSDWLTHYADQLGRRYASELARHY
jgi:uncharacterized protein YbjT (DUF2867 family)